MDRSRKLAPHSLREPNWPAPGTQCHSLTGALRMVRMYGDRVPTVERLQSDFGLSRATAYRWRAAFVASLPIMDAA